MIQARRLGEQRPRTPAGADDPSDDRAGRRIAVLVTRYRPRGIRRGGEPWDRWDRRLAPSEALLDALRGKRREGRQIVARGAPPLAWDGFTRRFLEEMRAPDGQAALEEYRARSACGEEVTLLCHCEDPARCHRSLLVALLAR